MYFSTTVILHRINPPNIAFLPAIRHPDRKASNPPVNAPAMIWFVESSLFRRPISAQSVIEKIPAHIAKLPTWNSQYLLRWVHEFEATRLPLQTQPCEPHTMLPGRSKTGNQPRNPSRIHCRNPRLFCRDMAATAMSSFRLNYNQIISTLNSFVDLQQPLQQLLHITEHECAAITEHQNIRWQGSSERKSSKSVTLDCLYYRMEEIQDCMMGQVRLEQNFDAQQWESIRKKAPKEFQRAQAKALECMMNDKSLYEKYFDRFYENHQTLFGWYSKATRMKPELQKYVFRLLVDNRITFDNEKLQKAMQGGLDGQRKHKGDSHALYLKTFQACNGWKYIFYNYEKHMKGASQRTKHNKDIRMALKTVRVIDNKENDLSQFQEFRHQQDKIALFSFTQVLANTKFNSRQEFERILKRNQLQKLVFVNHQRKPINYVFRARRPLKVRTDL